MQSSDKRIQFYIGGMTCINCQNKIERALKHTEGILRVSISYSKGTADIVYDEKQITLDEIIAVIENLEYQVILEKEQQETDLLDRICILVIIEGVWEATPERLQVCYDELDRISKLVSDLERLQQVENENLNLQKTEVDLLELAKGVVRNFETKISQKNIQCLVDGVHVIALVDERKMQQVITNLLSNAIKYSHDYGVICILVEDTGEQVMIQVEDDGSGIAKEDQKWIFERFYRTDKSRNRKTGGAGIGLAIVKTIVQAHDGQVKVESEEGYGSKFVVILPKSEKPV